MSVSRSATLNIGTPEGVVFTLPLAGPVTRSVAYTIDMLIMSIVLQLIMPLFGVTRLLSADLSMGLMILIQFAFVEGSRMVLEILWRGQTIGKRMLGLRVVDERGLKLKPSQLVVRNLLRFVDVLPLFYAVGGMVSLLNSRAQRLGDLAAGTVVVRNIKSAPPDVAGILEGKYNSFKSYPHLEARLRQSITPEEAQIALQALVRREDIEQEARVKIYEELAARFRSKVKFPDEAVFSLSDEQYVRNVVETLFRKRTKA